MCRCNLVKVFINFISYSPFSPGATNIMFRNTGEYQFDWSNFEILVHTITLVDTRLLLKSNENQGRATQSPLASVNFRGCVVHRSYVVQFVSTLRYRTSTRWSPPISMASVRPSASHPIAS